MVPADSAPLRLPPSPAAANDGGSLLANRYRLELLLGKGGMGEVWAATDTKLKRQVAVKLIHRKLADHADFARSFVRETELAARLIHENIPRIYTTEIAPDGRPFMVMEQVPGITLRRYIEVEGKVPPVRMICYAMYAVEALGCAHAAGIQHRDIKPENLMVSEDGRRAWVLDFGIAKGLMGDEGASTDGLGGSDKRRSTLLGTPGYVPPEVGLGGVADHRGDFWQVGVTIYEAISGKKPFPVGEDDKTGALSALVFDDPPPLAEDECPAGLWVILMRLLAKAPEDRYGSAEELLAALLALLSQFRESVPAGHLMALVVQKDQQKRVVRRAFASTAPVSEPPAQPSTPGPVSGVHGYGETEPLQGRPTLPLGSAFVPRSPAFQEATAEQEEEGKRGTLPMPPGFVTISPAHPVAKRTHGEVTTPLGGTVKVERTAATAAPLEKAAPRVRRAWVEGPGLTAVPSQPEPARAAMLAEAAPLAARVAVPAKAVLAAPAAAARPSPMIPALVLAALSIGVLGMGIGMMVEARHGQRRAEDVGTAPGVTAPVTTASAVPTVTASAAPAVTASAAPVVTASAAPVRTAASVAPARTAARPEPPSRRSPEIVDPFASTGKKAAKR